MEEYNIYKDICQRTKGDIYLGVVGPVRTGKSTFIKNFMNLMVLPNIADEYTRERAIDEMPQSASGITIMTTEPKFVPNEAVEIIVEDDISMKVRMIDCVGFLVEGANGHMEDDGPRMINTPWSKEKITFEEAATIGTKKVIEDHSTIGLVITTDGTVTDLPRENYVHAEEKTVRELQNIKKPFCIILNTSMPYSSDTEDVVEELKEKYNAPVLPINCGNLKRDDVNQILENVLYEFPVREIRLNIPKWFETLNLDHWLKSSIISGIKSTMESIAKLKDIRKNIGSIEENEYIKKAYIDKIYLGEGRANIEINLKEDLFYRVLSETTNMDIDSEYELISNIKVLAEAKREYDKIKFALDEVNRKGYGIVSPTLEDISIHEPEVIKSGSQYSVRVKANAGTLHIIKADIETEITPVVGSEEQSRDLINYLKDEMRRQDGNIWELNIFGRTMSDMVRDGLQNKIYRMPEDAQSKLQETIQRIVNEGNGGMICILL